MVTWADVQRWDSGVLEPVIDALSRAEDRLLGQADEAKAAAIPVGWTGTAAVAAAGRLQRVGDTAELTAAELAATKRCTMDASDAIAGLVRGVEEARELAGRYGFTITASGSIPPQPCTAGTPLDVVAHRRRVRGELIDRVEQTLRHANDIDRDLCGVLHRILGGDLVDVTSNNLGQQTAVAAYTAVGAAAGALSELAPPANATPSDNAAWWATLSDSARSEVIAEHPKLVGPRDGLPTAARDAANRHLLRETKAILERQLDHLRAQLADDAGGPGTRFDRRELARQISATEGKLGGIETIEQRLKQAADAPADEKYYLLGIDATGDGQAIIAKGNPDTATNVATYVPGAGSELAGIGGGMDRSDRMYAAAVDAERAPTAVITWYGYRAPDSWVDATSDDYANRAQGDLDSFQRGLVASHDDSLSPAHHTVLGHSYGGTVVGYAARDHNGLAADELVLIAAPGVGVEQADGLNMPYGHVWAASDPDDPVGDTQIFGNDPTDDDFYAREFKADAKNMDSVWYQGGYNMATHSAYWEPGSSALEGMGSIIAGQKPENTK